MGWPGVTVAAAGRCGAAYTGRGPVCGVISRRGGTLEIPLAAACGGAAVGGAAGGFATTAGFSAAASMLATCVCAGATGAAGFSAGRGGTIGAVGFAAAGGAAGLLIGAAAGLLIAAGASGAVCLLMALSTSPGLEIFERSIFGFISAAAAGALRFSAAASAALAKCLRTLSASSCSSELEWLFFSVTPMLGR